MLNPHMQFADEVRRVLDEHGCSLRSQRQRTGLAHSTIKNWLDGVRPQMEAVIAFAQGFELDVNHWLAMAGYGPAIDRGPDLLHDARTFIEGMRDQFPNLDIVVRFGRELPVIQGNTLAQELHRTRRTLAALQERFGDRPIRIELRIGPREGSTGWLAIEGIAEVGRSQPSDRINEAIGRLADRLGGSMQPLILAPAGTESLSDGQVSALIAGLEIRLTELINLRGRSGHVSLTPEEISEKILSVAEEGLKGFLNTTWTAEEDMTGAEVLLNGIGKLSQDCGRPLTISMDGLMSGRITPHEAHQKLVVYRRLADEGLI